MNKVADFLVKTKNKSKKSGIHVVDWLEICLPVFKIHSISILFIALIYILFWHVPQVKDVFLIIIQKEDNISQMILFFGPLTVLAFLIAYLYDYFVKTKGEYQQRTNEVFAKLTRSRKEEDLLLENLKEDRKYFERMLPKILGTLLIVITAFAINHTYHETTGKSFTIFGLSGNIGFYVILLLLILSLIRQVSLGIRKRSDKFDKKGFLPIILGLLCIGAIGYFGLANKMGADNDIRNLFYAILSLAAFFFLTTTSYNKYILAFREKAAKNIIRILIVIVSVLFLILFFSPKHASYFNPISIILVNFITYFSFISFLKYLGRKYRKSILKIVIGLFIGFGWFVAYTNDYPHFEVSSVKSNHTVSERLELNNYIKHWLNERHDAILNSNEFPVIFVSSEGGGSRAGLWSFLIHSYLYERNSDYFDNYLFSLTGASGGGVGNGLFYSTVYNKNLIKNKKFSLYNTQKDSTKISFKYKASSFYQGDYISSSVAGLMGRDFFKSTFDFSNWFNFRDRGKLVESEWEKKYKMVFESNHIGKGYLSIMPQLKGENKVTPLLMTNTTHIQSGQRAIISPIKFTNNKYMKGFRDFLYNYSEHNTKDSIIKISTAMLLNARFPFLSPVGKVKGVGQYGDAGYYDNIGGAVTRGLESAFNNVLNDSAYADIKGIIKIKHLVIANKEKSNEIKSEDKKLKSTNKDIDKEDSIPYKMQLIAPLNAILGATFAHPNEMKNSYPEFLIESQRTEIKNKDGNPIEPILPLGRILSKNAILSLEARLIQVQSKLDKLIKKKE